MFFSRPPKFLIHFNDGAFVKQLDGNKNYSVRFLNRGMVVFKSSLTRGHWVKTNQRYRIPWLIEILHQHSEVIITHGFSLKDKKVRVNIDSKCLGDTLAWLPQVERFAQQNPATDVFVSQFLSGLGFKRQYPSLRFINPDSESSDYYATFCIGFYFDDIQDYHPADPRLVPLGQVASDILGIKYEEKRPRLTVKNRSRPFVRPYVCIATQSTAGCKLWQHENGWQSVINYLKSKGLSVVVIQKEPCEYQGVINKTGDLPLQDRMTDLQYCEFFIGLGSGLSWLAWALKKRVILISGFSLPYSEFTKNCIRINNDKVCHGCWNSTKHIFNRDDWNWCPEQKGTLRHFECTRTIQPEQVYKAIDRLIRND